MPCRVISIPLIHFDSYIRNANAPGHCRPTCKAPARMTKKQVLKVIQVIDAIYCRCEFGHVCLFKLPVLQAHVADISVCRDVGKGCITAELIDPDELVSGIITRAYPPPPPPSFGNRIYATVRKHESACHVHE